MTEPHIIEVSSDRLLLDPQNPRLCHPVIPPNSGQTVVAIALHAQTDLTAILAAIAVGRLVPAAQPPLLTPADRDDRYTVIDGNRTVAALRLRHDTELRRALCQSVTLPEHMAEPGRLPALLYPDRAAAGRLQTSRNTATAGGWDTNAIVTRLRQATERGATIGETAAETGLNHADVGERLIIAAALRQLNRTATWRRREAMRLMLHACRHPELREAMGIPTAADIGRDSPDITDPIPEDHMAEALRLAELLLGTPPGQPPHRRCVRNQDDIAELASLYADPQLREQLNPDTPIGEQSRRLRGEPASRRLLAELQRLEDAGRQILKRWKQEQIPELPYPALIHIAQANHHTNSDGTQNYCLEISAKSPGLYQDTISELMRQALRDECGLPDRCWVEIY